MVKLAQRGRRGVEKLGNAVEAVARLNDVKDRMGVSSRVRMWPVDRWDNKHLPAAYVVRIAQMIDEQQRIDGDMEAGRNGGQGVIILHYVADGQGRWCWGGSDPMRRLAAEGWRS